MKAFPFFIPEKKRQISFQTKISVTHRFRCFTSCQPRPFYRGIIVRVKRQFSQLQFGGASLRGDSRSERQSAERMSSGSAPALSRASPAVACY